MVAELLRKVRGVSQSKARVLEASHAASIKWKWHEIAW